MPYRRQADPRGKLGCCVAAALACTTLETFNIKDEKMLKCVIWPLSSANSRRCLS